MNDDTDLDELLDIELAADHATITKLGIDRKPGTNAPVVMTLTIETSPVDMNNLEFLLPPGDPFAFWNSHGDLEDNAPKTMDMKYKTKYKHYIVIDDVVNFVAHQFENFKTVPASNRRLLVGFTLKVIDPSQELIVKMAHRIKSPIRFNIEGRVPEAQMNLSFDPMETTG